MHCIKIIIPCLPFLACGAPNPGATVPTPTKESTAPQPTNTRRGRMVAAVCTAAMLALGACGSDANTMPNNTTDAGITETDDAGAPVGGEGGEASAQGGSAGSPQNTGTAGAAGSGGQPETGIGGEAGTAAGGQGATPGPSYPEPPAREDLTWEHVFTSGRYLLAERLESLGSGKYKRLRTYTIVNSTEFEGLYGCSPWYVNENTVRAEETGPFLIIRHATKEDFTTYGVMPARPLDDDKFGESSPMSYLTKLFGGWRNSGGRNCSFLKEPLEES